MRYLTLIIPVVFCGFAVMDCGFFFRAATTLSCAVILGLISDRTLRPLIWWIIAALIVSSVADWFMAYSSRGRNYFIYGVCLFFVAHLGYILFSLKNGHLNRWLLTALLAVYLCFFFFMLYPGITGAVMFSAVLAYLVVSCISLAATIGIRLKASTRWGFAFGIFLLVFSDTIIALGGFAGYGGLDYLVLPTYFASQIVITFALINKKNIL